MKKVCLIIGMVVILLTGCSTDALDAYQKAAVSTGKIDKGNLKIELGIHTTFITDGLTATQINDLNYFDEILLSMNIQFDHSKEPSRVIAKSYYNFGGMGLDSVFYMHGQEMYIKIPITDKYVNLDNQELFQEESFSKIFGPIQEKWHLVLNQEDVFKEKKTYILTDEGQIKTTMYSIDASESQLKGIGDAIVKVVKDENLLEKFAVETGNEAAVDNGFYLDQMEEYITRGVLVGFKGDAYVDFDGRLVKEAYTISLGIKDAKKGEPSTMDISFVIEYLNLGEEQVFRFPEIGEDEWMDMSNAIDREAVMPDHIFN